MIRALRISVLAVILILSIKTFSYITLFVRSSDEKSSEVVRELISCIEQNAIFSKIIRIQRDCDTPCDYYINSLTDTNRKILVAERENIGKENKAILTIFEGDSKEKLVEAIYNIMLNKVGIPIKNVLLDDGTIKFISPFPYADSYLIKGKTSKIITDFKVNYVTGEVEILGKLQFFDAESVILPLNSFGQEISGPFSSIIASKVEVEYIPSVSRIYITNKSDRSFYTYLFTTEGLYSTYSGNVIGDSSTHIQVNWRAKKVYLAISEEKLIFNNFEDFKILLRKVTESGKALIYSFRFPENINFKSIDKPSIEFLDYDYINKRFILKLNDKEFDKTSDEYSLVVDKAQEFVFKSTDILFGYTKPVGVIEIVKRKTEKGVTFESQPFSREISNTPPGILPEKFEVFNEEVINFRLVDLDGDTVKVLEFKSDDPGIQIIGTKIFFVKAKVGEHKITFKLSDGRIELTRDIKIVVLNTPPKITNFDVSIEDECIVINYDVKDPDPQSFQTTLVAESLSTKERVTKSTSLLAGEMKLKVIPISEIYKIKLTVNDGFEQISKEDIVQYNSKYIVGNEEYEITFLSDFPKSRTIRIQNFDWVKSESAKLIYAVSPYRFKPYTFWELMNTDDLIEVDLTGKMELNIEAGKSGYYHFGIIYKNKLGQICFRKFEPFFINQAPKITALSSSVLGFQAIINVSVLEPDSDDYKITVLQSNLDTGEEKSTIFEKGEKIVLFFREAGIYEIQLFATDSYGVQSKEEKIRLQVPNELPNFLSLIPNGVVLKPTQVVTLRWELKNTIYNLPVTYDVYVGESPQELKFYASTKSSTIDLKVISGRTYYWKVLAKYSKNLQTESPICRFYVEKEFIKYVASIEFSQSITKVIQDSRNIKFYVLLSDGSLVRISEVPDKEYEIFGKLYSTSGDFYISGDYLLNYTTNAVFVYSLNRLNLEYWGNFKDEIFFANVYGDTLLISFGSRLILYNLKNKTSTSFSLSQTLRTKLYITPYFIEEKQLVIFPNNSSLLFIDLERQKIVREETIYSRGEIFFCDRLDNDFILTLDVYGQMRIYKLTDELFQIISVNETGISYPSNVVRLKNRGIIFSNSGKICMYEWNEFGAVKLIIKEIKVNLESLVAPSEKTIVYLTRNRVEYCKYDDFSVIQTIDLPITIPGGMFIAKNYLLIHDRFRILFYEIQE